MLIIAVMNIGQTFKPCCQRFTHVPFALETRAPRLASSRHLQDTIVSKECHDTIKIVRVEGFTYLLQCGSNLHLDLLSKVARVDILCASDVRVGSFASEAYSGNICRPKQQVISYPKAAASRASGKRSTAGSLCGTGA